jgi:nucleotide-binding universal stress UspA family protein
MLRPGAAHDDAGMDDTPILICYDGSEGAHRAIDAAAALLGPRRAVVLDIGPAVTPVESLATIASAAPAIAFEQENADDALHWAQVGAQLARGAGFDAEPRAAVAAPTWAGIVEVADELDAPLIVIGSRGLTGLREVAEGSVSHDVVAHAGRPVLVVPPKRGDD